MIDDGDDDSVTLWLHQVKSGSDAGADAAGRLWKRYFDRLSRLAHARLRAAPHGPADGEDVALSAFDAFFRGVAEGRFPRLEGRDDLWRLLVSLALREASNQRRRERQQKRGGGRVRPGTDVSTPGDGDVLSRVAATSRPPSSPPRWPRRSAAASAPSPTAPSASSPCSAWRVTPTTRSPPRWGAACVRWSANSA